MKNKNLLTIVAAGLAALLLGACTTMEYVPIDRAKPETTRSQLSVGEDVSIRLKNGEHAQFRITALEPDALVGRGRRVAWEDIDLLEVRSTDYAGTTKTVLAAGALGLVLVAVAILEAESDDADSQPVAPCRTNGSGGMVCTPH